MNLSVNIRDIALVASYLVCLKVIRFGTEGIEIPTGAI
jgi:hypothetical protein